MISKRGTNHSANLKLLKKKIDGCSAFGVLFVGVDVLTAGNIPQVVN
jgi:hypothetical protein